MFEDLLINHCSPTLAGIKPANLFTYTKPDAIDMVSLYNKIFKPYGIELKILKYSNFKYLIYLYRINLVAKRLNDYQIQSFLSNYGYDIFDVKSCLKNLSTRLKKTDFPHEIGIFLGYPLEDVKMFIINKGKNYKISGVWKVYCNEEKSLETFKSYKKCISEFSYNFKNGIDIKDMCVA